MSGYTLCRKRRERKNVFRLLQTQNHLNTKACYSNVPSPTLMPFLDILPCPCCFVTTSPRCVLTLTFDCTVAGVPPGPTGCCCTPAGLLLLSVRDYCSDLADFGRGETYKNGQGPGRGWGRFQVWRKSSAAFHNFTCLCLPELKRFG